MTSKRLKKLARRRLILSVIAVLLAGLMVVSGVMHFGNNPFAPPAEEPTESAVETIAPTLPENTDSAGKVESPESETTEAETEASESFQNELEEQEIEQGSKPDEDPDFPKDQPSGITPTKPTKPKPTEPKPTEPKATEPKATEPKATEPKATEPKATEPKATEPKATEPKATEPKATEPKATEPKATEPKATEPKATELSHETTQQSDALEGEYPDGLDPENKVAVIPKPEETESTEETVPAELDFADPQDPDNGEKNISGTDGEAQEKSISIWAILFWASTGLFVLDLLAILMTSSQIKKEKKRLRRVRRSLDETDRLGRQALPRTESTESYSTVTASAGSGRAADTAKVGTVHQIGRRGYQQDSLGQAAVLGGKGTLAVVADGMGGLSGGEKVSQKIVMDMLALGHQLKPNQVSGALRTMLDTVNENVNRMLGPEGLFKSGSTLVAVLAYENRFQWIAVGDSRIYLYRQGYANQLNHDHDQLQVWMADVLSGRRSIEETLRNPDGRKLTSFIGMGQLKLIDGSRGAIPLEPGDRLVLMSDGIYNVVTEDRLAEVLKRYPDVEQAAAVIESMVRDGNNPHQDNYTAIVLGF